MTRRLSRFTSNPHSTEEVVLRLMSVVLGDVVFVRRRSTLTSNAYVAVNAHNFFSQTAKDVRLMRSEALHPRMQILKHCELHFGLLVEEVGVEPTKQISMSIQRRDSASYAHTSTQESPLSPGVH